jgi:N-acetylneuraminic acid mutarotase
LTGRGGRCLAGVGAFVALAAVGCSAPAADRAAESSFTTADPTPRATRNPGDATAPVPPVEDMPRWQRRPGLGVARDDFGTALVGDEIWVLGGMTGDRGHRLDSVEVLDTSTGRWRLADVVLPEGLAAFEAVAVDEAIYVFGGLDAASRASDFAAVLDTATGRWQRLPPLPVARYAHTVTLHEGRVYVIGGEGRRGRVARVDVFDPNTETWSTGAPMPHARGSHDAVSDGRVLYVLGGWRDGAASALVHTYDPRAGRWARAEPLPVPVSRAGAAFADGRLWVSWHEHSFVLDTTGGTWAEANPLTVPRHGLGYVAVGNRIYGVGGCTPSPLRDVRAVDVLDVV